MLYTKNSYPIQYDATILCKEVTSEVHQRRTIRGWPQNLWIGTVKSQGIEHNTGKSQKQVIHPDALITPREAANDFDDYASMTKEQLIEELMKARIRSPQPNWLRLRRFYPSARFRSSPPCWHSFIWAEWRIRRNFSIYKKDFTFSSTTMASS